MDPIVAPVDMAVTRSIASKRDKQLTDAWALISVRAARDDDWLLFMRNTPSNVIEALYIRVVGSRAQIIIAGRPQSMKRARRKRVTGLAHQAIAYASLMGTVEGFPRQEEI